MERSRVRKLAVSVSMSAEVMDLVERIGQGDSFSAKLEWITRELQKRFEQLVAYTSEEQWETGSPELLSNMARRLFSVAAFGTGIEDDLTPQELVLLTSSGCTTAKAMKNADKLEVLVGEFKKAGYIIQVIRDSEHDVIDVWIDLAGGGMGCRFCKKLNDAINIMKRELFEK